MTQPPLPTSGNAQAERTPAAVIQSVSYFLYILEISHSTVLCQVSTGLNLAHAFYFGQSQSLRSLLHAGHSLISIQQWLWTLCYALYDLVIYLLLFQYTTWGIDSSVERVT